MTTMIENLVEIHTGQFRKFVGTLNNKNEQDVFAFIFRTTDAFIRLTWVHKVIAKSYF